MSRRVRDPETRAPTILQSPQSTTAFAKCVGNSHFLLRNRRYTRLRMISLSYNLRVYYWEKKIVTIIYRYINTFLNIKIIYGTLLCLTLQLMILLSETR